jgi:predicted phosphoribosyltransferase
MWNNREDAARQLAQRLRRQRLTDPLVLAIPRGGVVIGSVLARELGAALDIVLACKVRDPADLTCCIGGIAETGELYLTGRGEEVADNQEDDLVAECRYQETELTRRQGLYRGGRAQAPIAGRSVIVADDGVATGATMLGALKAIRCRHPREVIVAVPVVAPAERETLDGWCDEVVCLLSPEMVETVGSFYRDFPVITDEKAAEILRAFAPAPGAEIEHNVLS